MLAVQGETVAARAAADAAIEATSEIGGIFGGVAYAASATAALAAGDFEKALDATKAGHHFIASSVNLRR